MSSSRMTRAALLLSLVALGWSSTGRAEDVGEPPNRERATWSGTWGTGPAGSGGPAPQFEDQTLRQIVHTSAGGERVRLRISNTFGSSPLLIGSAHVALRGSRLEHRRRHGPALIVRCERSSITVPAGGLVLSDPAPLDVPAALGCRGEHLSSGVLRPRTPCTSTPCRRATSPRRRHRGRGVAGATTTTSWSFLTGVDVSRGHERERVGGLPRRLDHRRRGLHHGYQSALARRPRPAAAGPARPERDRGARRGHHRQPDPPSDGTGVRRTSSGRRTSPASTATCSRRPACAT